MCLKVGSDHEGELKSLQSKLIETESTEFLSRASALKESIVAMTNLHRELCVASQTKANGIPWTMES